MMKIFKVIKLAVSMVIKFMFNHTKKRPMQICTSLFVYFSFIDLCILNRKILNAIKQFIQFLLTHITQEISDCI